MSMDRELVGEFQCGWGAAFINIVLTYPINKIMFRQMLHGVGVGAASRQLYGEGMLCLYRGILPPLFQKTVSVSLMFGMYEHFQRQLGGWTRHAPGAPHWWISPTAAALAGCTEALLTPCERVQTLLQDRAHHGSLANTWHTCRHVAARGGVAEFYRGLAPVLWRNCLSNVVFFEMRRVLAALRTRHSPTSSSSVALVWDFVGGALIGAFTSTVMYPLNVVKTHAQSRIGGPFVGVGATLREIYRARGHSISAIYRGVHVNYTRSLISWGIINCTYEMLKSMRSEETTGSAYPSAS